MSPLLLDTHVWVWIGEGMTHRLSEPLIGTIEAANQQNQIFVSTVSAWELGMLTAKQRLRFSVPVREWVLQMLEHTGFRLLPLDVDAALDASYLPGTLHGDPADRLLVATARVHGLRLATADAKLIEYGKQHHVNVLPL
jgi:PIN domain nuclease of toxin-antitoxin system